MDRNNAFNCQHVCSTVWSLFLLQVFFRLCIMVFTYSKLMCMFGIPLLKRKNAKAFRGSNHPISTLPNPSHLKKILMFFDTSHYSTDLASFSKVDVFTFPWFQTGFPSRMVMPSATMIKGQLCNPSIKSKESITLSFPLIQGPILSGMNEIWFMKSTNGYLVYEVLKNVITIIYIYIHIYVWLGK